MNNSTEHGITLGRMVEYEIGVGLRELYKGILDITRFY